MMSNVDHEMEKETTPPVFEKKNIVTGNRKIEEILDMISRENVLYKIYGLFAELALKWLIALILSRSLHVLVALVISGVCAYLVMALFKVPWNNTRKTIGSMVLIQQIVFWFLVTEFNLLMMLLVTDTFQSLLSIDSDIMELYYITIKN